jgi:uncharacterized phage-like protein YoqJ
MEEKALSFSGHRPDKLGGFSGERAKAIQDGVFGALVHVVQRSLDHGFNTFITGGAIGVDQIAAEAVLHRKKNPVYAHAKLIIAKPFPSQGCKWPQHVQEYFKTLCDKVDQVLDVSEDPYTREKMQVRNEWMVNRSAACCAVWNGGNGGTGNYVRYARSIFKPILIVNPYTLVEKWELPDKVKW